MKDKETEEALGLCRLLQQVWLLFSSPWENTEGFEGGSDMRNLLNCVGLSIRRGLNRSGTYLKMTFWTLILSLTL